MRRGMRSFRFTMCSCYDVMFVLLMTLRRFVSEIRSGGTRCRKREIQCYPAWLEGRSYGIRGAREFVEPSPPLNPERRSSSSGENINYHIWISGLIPQRHLLLDCGTHALTSAKSGFPAKVMKASAPEHSRHEALH